ncbi:putative stress-induced protein STI1 [Boletus reticuloceps]|uniref:Putative stress-induced protein STI1 n=1 Tax=Boletus reticuloceps TaxID=495285 RepID=A0A8I3A5X8_9AGAM|nr:putative stress-induced protein STI1 [Boletus reticuloceps]
MADMKKQQLVLSFVDFLNESMQDGTVKDDDQEGLEIAIQCIGEAFGVDPSNEAQRKQLGIKPAKLQTIFEVFLKTKDKVGSPSPASTPAAPSTSAPPKTPSAEDKKKAEKHKQTGNTQMSAKKYDAAIDSYSKAIALDPTNAVYFSNRAAAHSSKGDHTSAVEDARKAIEVDPSFVKAYSRLGHAHYNLGDYKAAAAAFSKGTELDPTNENLKSGLKNSRDHLPPEDDDEGPPPLMPEDQLRPSSPSSTATSDATPNLSGLTDMFGGEGGMPNLAGMMNNPMMMQMTQQLMANGGWKDSCLIQPWQIWHMGRVQSGQMPSMDELMSDPTLRDLPLLILA